MVNECKSHSRSGLNFRALGCRIFYCISHHQRVGLLDQTAHPTFHHSGPTECPQLQLLPFSFLPSFALFSLILKLVKYTQQNTILTIMKCSVALNSRCRAAVPTIHP